MIFGEDSYRYMYAALQEAEMAFENEEVPIGAVVVYNNRIIGRGYNQIEMLKDPTAHAEMIAITAASNFMKDWRLNNCDLYVTVEPCIMCTGALIAARVRNLFFGAFDPKFGACGSIYNIAEEGKSNHKINVFSGLHSTESENLLKKFFGGIRNIQKFPK